MIRIPMQGPPYYDWGLDRWKIGVALVLFVALMIWLPGAPTRPVATGTPSPTPVPVALIYPQPGTVDAGMPQLFEGTAPPDSQITVVDGDSGALGQTITAADGRWRLESDQPWMAGALRLQVMATHGASGAVLGHSGIIPVVALAAPLPPLTLEAQWVEPGSGQGDPRLLMAGNAPPGLTVSAAQMQDGQRLPLGQTQADATGHWQLQALVLPQPPFDLALMALDPTGLVLAELPPMRIITSADGLLAASPSETKTEIEIESEAETGADETFLLPLIDSAAEIAPRPDPLATPLGVDGLGPGSQILAGQVDTLFGTGQPGAQIQVVDRYLPAGEPITGGSAVAETVLGVVSADGDGRWQLALNTPLAWGRHALSLRQLDSTGVPTAQIGPIVFHALAPNEAVRSDQPVILTPSVNGQISGADPHFAGTALAGSQVRLLVFPGEMTGPTDLPRSAATSIALAWVNRAGQWSIRLGEQLAAGTYHAQAVALDPAGEEAARSQPLPFVILPATGEDVAVVALSETATPPAQATQPPTPPVPPAGGIVVSTRLPRFSGQTTPGRLLRVRITDSQGAWQQGIVAAKVNGQWSFVPAMPLAIGPAQASVQMLDGSAAVGNQLFVEISPQATLSGASATGLQLMSPMPGPLSNRLAPISGLAPPDSTVTVLLDDQIVATVQADSRGYWFALPPEPLADGTARLTVINGQGDTVDQAIGPLRLTVAPETPTIFQPAIDTPTQRADTAQFALTGIAQPGQAVVVVVNGVEEATVIADGSGRWRWQVADPQAEGPVYVQARIVAEDGMLLSESPVQVVIYFVPLGG